MTMKSGKQQRLKSKGWKLGDAADFLNLSAEEQALLELKLELGRQLRKCRIERSWTQNHFAKLVRSSQTRVAKMESGDPSVSLDLLVKSLLVAGATRKDIAREIGGER